MNNLDSTYPPPTDMLFRRIRLPFKGHFTLVGKSVTIHTNSTAVLHAAKRSGFVQRRVGGQSALIWEIVAEPNESIQAKDWTCTAVTHADSIYMGMGSQQWFAFDLATGDGAGFVVIADQDVTSSMDAQQYFRAIVNNVHTELKTFPQESRYE